MTRAVLESIIRILLTFTAENISDIVREAVGGVKSYIDEALAQQKENTSKSIESSKVQFKFKGNRVQFNFNISLLDSMRTFIACLQKGEIASATLRVEQCRRRDREEEQAHPHRRQVRGWVEGCR